jgi:uncharacterized 2Fe-2S/4Fe-4S cluster protein (DUF4445 family)
VEYTVTIHAGGEALPRKAAGGENLLKLLQREGFEVPAPCGGSQRCGKCGVGVAESPAAAPAMRLACSVFVGSDMDVYIGDGAARSRAAQIVTAGARPRVKPNPYVRAVTVDVAKPSLGDQRSDLERTASAVAAALRGGRPTGAGGSGSGSASAGGDGNGGGGAAVGSGVAVGSGAVAGGDGGSAGGAALGAGGGGVHIADVALLRSLPGMLRESDYRITCICAGSQITDIKPRTVNAGGLGDAGERADSGSGGRGESASRGSAGSAPDSGAGRADSGPGSRGESAGGSSGGEEAGAAVAAASKSDGGDCLAAPAGRRHYGIAFDIGTTTIAAYLCELSSGAIVEALSAMNPQARYGADVISRISHAMQGPAGAADMHGAIADALNGLISRFIRNNGIDREDIGAACAAGNTTMLHFLMDLPAAGIAVAPFIPATTDMHVLAAAELGLRISRNGRLICMPGVSAYIGADTVAAALACRLGRRGEIGLLIDIGTNGEIALGCRDWLLACSTAAGPAFEGANIRNGVGGVEGAIDTVRIGAGGFAVTTIAGGAGIGLCGSGLVDAAAALLDCGAIDETGRLLDADEIDVPASYGEGLAALLRTQISERLVRTDDGKDAFLLLDRSRCAAGSDIALTQRDIRELQNAKAAIAAGIKTLIARAGISAGDIGRVFLAGGFGSYINKDSAVRIGLIPSALSGRIEAVGNAAGAGAVEALLSRRSLGEAQKLKGRIEYLELSATPEFTGEYIECMSFEPI